jgi:hypothetical protein
MTWQNDKRATGARLIKFGKYLKGMNLEYFLLQMVSNDHSSTSQQQINKQNSIVYIIV